MIASTPSYQTVRRQLRRYCAYQERNKAEVASRLAQHSSLTAAEKSQLMEELCQEDFLQEDRYITAFIRGKFYIKKWGKMKISRALASKKIAPEIIHQALATIPDTDYKATLQALIHLKSTYWATKDALQRKQKIVAYLLQKGYEYESIVANIEQYFTRHDR
jgi:regulatory protein